MLQLGLFLAQFIVEKKLDSNNKNDFKNKEGISDPTSQLFCYSRPETGVPLPVYYSSNNKFAIIRNCFIKCQGF